ncbi:sulfatase [Thalassoroseus pseudoceratinae]|uniref:sulfatase n=1 Tax=Thalassoroseus pseudoceratinae TaxID=2713176 RepID=UPI00197FDD6F|nr:sulfatase [Thalassoroseus pseudoceratinae]
MPRGLWSLVFVSMFAGTCLADEAKPNVLFIAVDDLRPELGCFGKSKIHSPNIDRLAADGTVFERAYCMVPTCGASRASLMTGIRPTRQRFVSYQTWAEKDAPGITTLNTHFREHGYVTLSNGKVFHHAKDNGQGWSKPAWRPRNVQQYQLPESRKAMRQNPKGRGPAYEAADVSDNAYADGHIAEKTIKDLGRLAKQDEPFFLAVGFMKPHLPFVAPQKYWDLYDAESIQLPKTYHRPKNAPDQAIHNWGELRQYANIPATGKLSDEMARRLIHGYYACVSYTDAQIGKLLDELERLKLAENTIVVLWGDHGWNLGEHTLWCKHCCFETSMHAPLIVKAPGMTGGQKTPGLTEFIDIYPSLCELAQLPRPEHLEGRSFVPLMKEPNREWKTAAIGRFRNGDTIRTDQFRFTAYTTPKNQLQARMLYDHNTDPEEDNNVADEPAFQDAAKNLLKELRSK